LSEGQKTRLFMVEERGGKDCERAVGFHKVREKIEKHKTSLTKLAKGPEGETKGGKIWPDQPQRKRPRKSKRG